MLTSRSLTLATLGAGLDEQRIWALNAVRSLADETGLPVYLVGGPVRDALLGAPVLDLDFSIEGDAAEFARQLSRSVDAELTVHQRFGTATVVTRQVRIDLVTARSETYARPGQLPDVKPGTIADDLARRDFTINAMALPLHRQGEQLVDPHHGYRDLEVGTVRALHDRSFIDDPTRLFRAVRYEQRLGFAIEERTLEWAAEAIADGRMAAVSGDRWRHELERILGEEYPGPALLRAGELGLLAGLHPALANAEGLQRLSHHAPEEVEEDYWLAALFAPLTTEEGEGLVNRLRMAGRMAAVARDTIAVGIQESEILAAGETPSALFQLLSPLEPAAVSAWAKLTPETEVVPSLRRYLDELRFVRPVLSGTELLALGVPQGPLMGEILSSLRTARLDGTVASEEEEQALVKSLLKNAKLNIV